MEGVGRAAMHEVGGEGHGREATILSHQAWRLLVKTFRLLFLTLTMAALGACVDAGPTPLTAPEAPSLDTETTDCKGGYFGSGGKWVCP